MQHKDAKVLLLLDLTPDQAAATLPVPILDLMGGGATVISPNNTDANEGVGIRMPNGQIITVTRADWFRIVQAIKFFDYFLGTFVPFQTRVQMVRNWILGNWPGAATGPATPNIINPNRWTGFTLIPVMQAGSKVGPFGYEILPVLYSGAVVRDTASANLPGNLIMPVYSFGHIVPRDYPVNWENIRTIVYPTFVTGTRFSPPVPDPHHYSGMVLIPTVTSGAMTGHRASLSFTGIENEPVFVKSQMKPIFPGVILIPELLRAI